MSENDIITFMVICIGLVLATIFFSIVVFNVKKDEWLLERSKENSQKKYRIYFHEAEEYKTKYFFSPEYSKINDRYWNGTSFGDKSDAKLYSWTVVHGMSRYILDTWLTNHDDVSLYILDKDGFSCIEYKQGE